MQLEMQSCVTCTGDCTARRMKNAAALLSVDLLQVM
jgi:hypothetical protein